MDQIDHFDFMVLTPAGVPDAKLAIAGSRAGAMGVLNLEYCRDHASACAALQSLQTHARGRIGVQVGDDSLTIMDEIAKNCNPVLDVVIVAGHDRRQTVDLISASHDINAKAMVVVTTLSQALEAEAAGADAVIARGHEAAGWVGDETSFVLLQRLRGQIQVPVWVQGGIGLHSIAAAAAGGAAGAVLDSQLLLTRESPLAENERSRIASMDGSETICLGTSLDARFRAYSRPGLAPLDGLRQRLTDLMIGDSPVEDRRSEWRSTVNAVVGWESVDEQVLAIGQDACFAKALADRFVTVGGIVAGLRESIASHAADARNAQALSPGSPLAQSHGTRFPLVQGPMTRVSDRAAFAQSVAEAGALPFVALALMRGPESRELLEQTAELLGDRPWGVGILGFVPPALRSEQLDVIRDRRPPFALIAGGRSDQARQLENDGITTYLHVPSPGLLRMYLNDGARRFVFEGRECGGHVGPRTSFVLWDTMVDVLLNDLPKGVDPATIHVLFAGGIHDGLSAAMVSCLAGPLSARGIRVGALIGSAYLFTAEAVSSGAITEGFQQAAIECDETVLLESGPGHATRCVPSPFADDFEREKRSLLQQALPSEEVRNRLEELNIGRLRIASKGVDRNPDFVTDPTAAKLIAVEPSVQWSQGMYMIGQVAALRTEVSTMADLHEQISGGAEDLLGQTIPQPEQIAAAAPAPCDIAIVGVGCIVPGASDLRTFWANVLNKVDAITEIPAKRWDWRQYYDPDRNARDKIYSKWGGFIDDVPFDPVSFGMPPSSLTSIEPFQLLALLVVRAALEDAGLMKRPFPRERTSVMLGAGGGGGDLSGNYVVRSSLPSLFGETASDLTDDLGNALPEWTEDSFAGILMNVAAGRVANRFDLGGLNYTVDAACASSLAAIYLAVRDLESGNSDVAIAGGVDAIQNPFAFLCFAKTQALSPTGHCRPFDAQADGIAISEGFATVVMKRLADAERDGDRIYAVIRGVGGASDGRDRSLTAPRPEGQMRALRRAYAQAHYDPSTVELIEAHGTGTVAGDQAEVEALSRFFSSFGAETQGTAIGSVKSMIGHTKAAAGVAGLIKVALALHHGVLPPTLGVTTPNPKADFRHSPLYVNAEARPWARRSDGQPRRAGVSAFGFGGTDFHVALEEYRGEYLANRRVAFDDWPSELFVWKATSRSDISRNVSELLTQLEQGASPALADLAFTLATDAARNRGGVATLAVVADSVDDLAVKLRGSMAFLSSSDTRVHLPSGVHFSDQPLAREGKVAFLFPGQGSQYVDMSRDLAVMFPEVRSSFERSDKAIDGALGRPLSRFIFPPPSFTPEEQQERQAQLTETNVAQPALGATSLALLTLLRNMGVEPDMAAGHSYGEFVALHAAGSYDEATLLRLSEARGRFMREGAGADAGTMAAVDAGAEDLAGLPGQFEVTLANLNAPRQTVISGSHSAVDRAVIWCTEHGLRARRLPVACAFHSPLVAPAEQRLGELLRTTAISPPRFPVFSNTTGNAHANDPASIAATLSEHLTRPVRWVDEVENMYAAGARVFVEVGPRSVLTGLVGQILEDRPHARVVLDQPKRNGITQLLHGLAMLAAEGIDLDLGYLFSGRELTQLDLANLARDTGTPRYSATTWMINGGRAIPASKVDQEQPHVPIPVRTVRNDGIAVPPIHQNDGLTRGTNADHAANAAASDHLNGRDVGSAGQVPSGFLTRNGGVSAMDSTPVSSFEPALEGDSTMTRGPGPAAPPGDSEHVMTMFQQVMQRFLDTQRSVMLAYLGGSVAAPQRSAARPVGGTRQPVSIQGTSSNGHSIVADRPVAPDRREQDLRAEPERPITGHEVTALTNGRELHPHLGATHQEDVAPVTPPPVETQVAAAGPSTPALTRDVLLEMLLKVVSDRTGYPTDMLAPDADLEADLGIDSIKRVEISGTIVQALHLPPEVSPDLERLTSSRTLNQVVETLLDMVSTPVTATALEEGTRPFDSAPDGERIGRFVLVTSDAPSVNSSGNLATDGVIVIVDDETGVGDRLARALVDRGHRTVRIVRETMPSGAEHVLAANIEQPAELTSLVERIHERCGRATALVHLPALSRPSPDDGFDTRDWHARRARTLDALFLMSQLLRGDLETSASKGGSAVLAATAIGGAFGSVNPARGMLVGDGALSGFVKTLAQEWPAVRIRAIDFDQTDPDIVAKALASELFSDDGAAEVAYLNEKRVRLALAPAPFSGGGDDPLDADSVVVITGGARGITAAVAETLAARYHSTLVLVGRTPLPRESEAEFSQGLLDRAELRKAVIDHLKARGEAPSVTTVEREVSRIIGEREVRETLGRIRDAGARAFYLSCDVRDQNEFGDLIDRVYAEHGRIDGVVHGAGIIEDKLVRDKQLDSFDRVISTKVDGALTLAARLRADSLKFLVFFGSVSGRFGNRGQADYAAANEILNKLACSLDRAWPARVVSINWGPWLKTGMVSPEVQRQFAERGVSLIPLSVGCRMLDEELRSGKKGEVEVVVGGTDDPEAMARIQRASPEVDRPQRSQSDHPLLSVDMTLSPSSTGTAMDRSFDLTVDRYLDHHRLDGRPVLPFAFASELMAEAANFAFPQLQVNEVRRIRLLNGLTFDQDLKSVHISTECAEDLVGDGSGVSVNVTVGSGEQPGRLHYRSTVDLATHHQPLSMAERLPQLSDPQPFPMSVEAAYREWLFHGPVFQRITSIDCIGPSGASAWLLPSQPSEALNGAAGTGWLVDPILVDAAFQMQVIWARMHWDVTLLPAEVGAISRFARLNPDEGPVRYELRIRSESFAPLCHADHYFFDRHGNLVGRLRDVVGAGSRELNRLAGSAR